MLVRMEIEISNELSDTALMLAPVVYLVLGFMKSVQIGQLAGQWRQAVTYQQSLSGAGHRTRDG